MKKKKKKSDLERFGISVQHHEVKKEITQKDLEKDLLKEIGNNIQKYNDIKDGRDSNN